MIEKFTKGPWVHDGFSLVGANGEKVVVSDGPALGSKTVFMSAEANANLVIASPNLYADLKTAAAQLRKYEELHRAKGTEDSLAKAEVNAELASRFEATLAKARGEV